MVYGGKVYETDGANPIAVHEWTDARLLSPVGHAPSVRLFESTTLEADWSGMAEGRAATAEFNFQYLNPSVVVGPQTELMPSQISDEISAKPCLACVVSADASLLTPEEAHEAILGLLLVNVFYAQDLARIERARSQPTSRSHDVGIAIGPAITTLDELEEVARSSANGAHYDLAIQVQVNESDVARLSTAELPFTLAEAVSYASSSCAVRAGDIIAISMGELELSTALKSGDDVRIISDRLGVLSNRIG